MARDGSGVYSLPAGSAATSGETIIPSVHNTPLADIAADLNVARPVVAGGTGATTASGARTNLGLGTISTQAASAVAVTGGTIDGTAIGGTTPAAGAFTTLGATGAATFGSTMTVAGELTATGGVKFASGVYIDNSGSGLSYYTNGGDHQMNCAGGAYLALGNAGQLNHYYPVATTGTTTAAFRSDVGGAATQVAVVKANGDINNATGAYGTISDARLKENIVDASPQWEDIKAMRFRNYNLIGQDKVLLGVVTQELIEAGMSDLVGENDDELKTQYAKMSVLFTKCAKGLQEAILRIEELESKVG